MCQIGELLSSKNIPVILPEDDNNIANMNITPKLFEEYKRKVSFRYLEKIRDPRTWSILVVNPEKHNIKNYIGANSFAEIAVAFARRKKIFILYDYPTFYEEELISWRVTALRGNIDLLVESYKKACIKKQPQQLPLF